MPDDLKCCSGALSSASGRSEPSLRVYADGSIASLERKPRGFLWDSHERPGGAYGPIWT